MSRTIQRSSFDPNQNNTIRLVAAFGGLTGDFQDQPNQGKLYANWTFSQYEEYAGVVAKLGDTEWEIPSWLEISRTNQGVGAPSYDTYIENIGECFNTFSLVEEGTYHIKGEIVFKNINVGTTYADFFPGIIYWFTGAEGTAYEDDLYYGPIDDHDAWWDMLYPINGQAQKGNPADLEDQHLVYYNTIVSVNKALGGRIDFKFSPVYNGDDITQNTIFGDEFDYPRNSFIDITKISSVPKQTFVEYHLS